MTLLLKDTVFVKRWLRERHQIYGSFFHILKIYSKAGNVMLLLTPVSIFQPQMRLLSFASRKAKTQRRELHLHTLAVIVMP